MKYSRLLGILFGALVMAGLFGGPSYAAPGNPEPTNTQPPPAKLDIKDAPRLPVPPGGPPTEESISAPIPEEKSTAAAQAGVWTYVYNEIDNQYVPNSGYPCQEALHTFPSWPIDAVYNDCNRRVWLRENANNSGWAFCIPGSVYGYVNDAYSLPGLLAVDTVWPCP